MSKSREYHLHTPEGQREDDVFLELEGWDYEENQPKMSPNAERKIPWFLPSQKRQVTWEHEKQPVGSEKTQKAMGVSEDKQTLDQGSD